MATSSVRRLLKIAGLLFLLLSTAGAGPALAAEGDGVPEGPAGVPAAPMGVTASVYSPTQILVTWNDNSNNETGFLVTDGTVNRSAGANYTWYMWGGLAPGTQKCFHVLARNGSGYSPWVGGANSCVTIPTVPAAPTGVTATPISANTIRVTWTDNSDNETGFVVNDGTVDRPAGVNYTWYDWGDLAPGTYKCFYVRSHNGAGSSPWAGDAPASCATTPTVPAAPTRVTATPISADTIRVTWTDNSDNETGFVVSDGTVERPAGVNYTWYDWGGLAPGTYKCFYVKSLNGPVASPWAGDAPASCATIPTVPAAPTGVTATAISASEIRVTWTDNSSNEAGFRVSDGAGAATLAPNTTSFTMGGLSYGTYKCFRVESFNVAGYSPSTPWACAAIRGAKGDD